MLHILSGAFCQNCRGRIDAEDISPCGKKILTRSPTGKKIQRLSIKFFDGILQILRSGQRISNQLLDNLKIGCVVLYGSISPIEGEME